MRNFSVVNLTEELDGEREDARGDVREEEIEEEGKMILVVGEGVYLVEGAEELREDGRFRGREGRLGEMNGRVVVIRRKDISVGVCVFEREGNGERRRLVVEERGERSTPKKERV